LTSNAYANDVRADEQRAQMIGVRGVPFFLFDEKYAVSGAQPSELFTTALQRTWTESHPVVELVGSNQDAGICDDESCAI
jgi:predicted DsbA family dithiol-disulfide isomerase